MGGPRDLRVPISTKWPNMLQWSSSEDEGGLGADEGGWSGSEEPLSFRAQGAPRRVYGIPKKGSKFDGGRARVVEESQTGEVGFEQGLEELDSTPGTPDLLWQDTLDFEEEDPGEQDAARSPWEEVKVGAGVASRMTSTGRRGGRLEAADAPSGRCGFCTPDSAAWEEQRPGRQVYGRRVLPTGCVVCGGCGAGGTTGAVARHEDESDESLEEGELGNSGSEAEWWERGKGRGDVNPVHKSFQVEKQLVRWPGGSKKERTRVEARTVQERPPLLSPGEESSCSMVSVAWKRERIRCAWVVRAGRTFCRRLALAMSGQELPHYHVRLKVGVREDLRMWATFLESFNGTPLKVWRDCEWDVQLFSDATGSTGFGLYWEGRWCAKNGRTNGRMGAAALRFWNFFR
ncbi:hypothetical protein NDU88_005778 [Pleurodeles waltl]|uniref:Uncharacterized protein n=1 Tax=Pleurodeles waltl TaxID=8319 RepID=A0AAV7NRJ0_PLEWA|nr:hypothetical protein NDU88_005778 [Pleurodeles waltl]